MTIQFRRGTMDDSWAVFQVAEAALRDLENRQGIVPLPGTDDAAPPEQTWKKRRSMYEHLARTAHEFWIAEQAGTVVGYARSILRDDVLELTEFFISPHAQAAGLGRELLRRAFPAQAARHRIIIATTDVRAQISYLKAGVVPRLPEMLWLREPENVRVETDLEFERVDVAPQTLEAMAQIDREILGHRRDADHEWLLRVRGGYLYRRNGAVVGYGYENIGAGSGPFALRNANDFAAALAHAEATAFERGATEIAFEVPMINRAAIDHLLARKYKLDAFIALVMSDEPFGKLENYILTSPPFFL